LDIDDQVEAKVIKKGWSEAEVLKLKADGCRYSPGRDSLLGPIMHSDDIGDPDEHQAGHQAVPLVAGIEVFPCAYAYTKALGRSLKVFVAQGSR
jgi:hypothetical protein